MKLLPVIHKPEAKILLLDLVLAILFFDIHVSATITIVTVFGKGKCVVKLHLIKLTGFKVARRLIATFQQLSSDFSFDRMTSNNY